MRRDQTGDRAPNGSGNAMMAASAERAANSEAPRPAGPGTRSLSPRHQIHRQSIAALHLVEESPLSPAFEVAMRASCVSPRTKS
jgi:hypothetical protein